MTTVLDAFRAVPRRHANAPFLTDGASDRTLTYAEADIFARRIASALAHAGVRRGDRVALLCENSPSVVLAYLGILQLQATLVPINPTISDGDLNYAIEMAAPRTILVSSSGEERLGRSPALRWPSIHRLAWNGDAPVIDGRDVRLIAPLAERGPADEDAEACITFTSGSTALPKGVIHTVRSLFGNALAFDRHARIGPRHRFLHLLPMSYMAGLLNLIVCPFMAGASIVVAPEFSARSLLDFWELPIRHGVNAYWLAPTMVALLLRGDRDRRAVGFLAASKPLIFVATAPLAAEAKREFAARYGAALRPSYGTSELLLITVNDPDAGHRDDSVGTPIDGVELSLRDVGPDGAGEILVRTPSTWSGYLGEAADPSVDGWSPTGDLGTMLASGELVITGRRKDLIITGGINVSPIAVERVMDEHPGVDRTAAIGLPDPVLGEVVVIAVRTRDGYRFEDVRRDLERVARERLSAAQRPSRIVQVDELPLSPTGKVKRAELRAALVRSLPT